MPLSDDTLIPFEPYELAKTKTLSNEDVCQSALPLAYHEWILLIEFDSL
jgi:hypothetical protein